MSIQALNDFLHAAKASLEMSRSVRVILGNQASDLDSMASSVAYAYLLSNDRVSPEETVLPVMNIPRADFRLRTEAVYLFNEVCIDASTFIFLDEIDLGGLRKNKHVKLVLIDHNKLAKSQEALANLVDEIIDHHKDDNLYPQVTKRTIEPVGSTATLIAERIIDRKAQLLDEGLATLLLGTILLDTANLDPSRAKPKDEAMVNNLSQVAVISRNALFAKVQFEKFNPGPLDTRDLLRKDYKEGQAGTIKYGISSVPISVSQWSAKDDKLAEGFRAYGASRNLDVLLTMHFYEDTEFRRELGLFSLKQELSEQIVSALSDADLQLDPISLTDQKLIKDLGISFFSQRNTKISRRILEPVLNALLTGSPSRKE